MSELAEKIVAIHDALSARSIRHAFGGALALAWCTGRARATIDIDINVFVGPSESESVLAALPSGIEYDAKTLTMLRKDGQVRCWWQKTPIDIFLNSTEFHQQLDLRAKNEPFYGRNIPFLSCTDLAVFKAFFNRSRDWADLEEMAAANTIDIDCVTRTLRYYLGEDDPRIEKLAMLAQGAR